MLNDYKMIFSLVIIRETSFKPLLHLVIYIKAKRFCVEIQIIFLLLEAIA
jgi:hypothetical protein